MAPDAPSLGLEPSAFRLLAQLVCAVAAAAGIDEDDIAAVGREHGRSLAVGARSTSCAEVLAERLAELGFDPATVTDGDGITVAFTRCPFRELAEVFPDVVCHLHRGMVDGIVDVVGGASVQRFGTLADRDPCQVELVGVSRRRG